MSFSIGAWNLVSAINMTANHLRKDEVAYELQVRGVDSSGSADELRKRLSSCFSKNTKIDDSAVNKLNSDRELEVCEEKFDDLSSLIDEYDGNGRDPEFKRLHARLYHLYIRVERIPMSAEADDEMEQRKTLLLVNTKLLLDSLEKHNKSSDVLQIPGTGEVDTIIPGTSGNQQLSFLPVGVPPPTNMDSQPLQDNLVKTRLVPASTASDQQFQFELPPVQSRNFRAKSIPVYKWGLKFDMESGQSVGCFLERVEELRRARGLSHQELFDSAVDLFSGPALIWYRSAVRRVSSWDQLCRELKLVFQSPDYDDMLQQEIRNRVQGPEEAIDLFLAAVEGLYGRLSVKLPENERLQQILKNLNPYLQEKLCMFEIKSLENLRELGRKAELGRLRSTSQHQPHRHHRVLEPDLAWGQSARRKNSQLASMRLRISGTSGASRSSDSSRKCWNCSEVGHRFSQCPKERGTFCYGCGSPNVKKANCSVCKSKNGRSWEPAK